MVPVTPPCLASVRTRSTRLLRIQTPGNALAESVVHLGRECVRIPLHLPQQSDHSNGASVADLLVDDPLEVRILHQDARLVRQGVVGVVEEEQPPQNRRQSGSGGLLEDGDPAGEIDFLDPFAIANVDQLTANAGLFRRRRERDVVAGNRLGLSVRLIRDRELPILGREGPDLEGLRLRHLQAEAPELACEVITSPTSALAAGVSPAEPRDIGDPGEDLLVALRGLLCGDIQLRFGLQIGWHQEIEQRGEDHHHPDQAEQQVPKSSHGVFLRWCRVRARSESYHEAPVRRSILRRRR